MQKNKNLMMIILAIICLMMAIITWQTFLYFQHRGKVGVSVVVIPNDSILKVDNQVTKPGKLYLLKGIHHLVASRVDFDDDVKNINTSDITKDEIIYMLPLANSSAAKLYLEQHPDTQKQREAAGGAEAERIRSLLLTKYPILTKLPHETLDYKIDYSVDANMALSLKITTYGIINGPSDYTQYVAQTAAFKQEALNYLKQNGISPNTYPITYVPNL